MSEEKFNEDIEKNENLNEEFSDEISDEISDDESGDLVIEIDEDDLEDLDFVDTNEDSTKKADDEIILSKHTIQGKHSLKYDSIFKGKKEDPLSDEEPDVMYFNDNFEVDKSSNYWFESMDNENYVKEKRVKEKVYDVLTKYTDLNFLNNRRKPSRTDFNNYYYLLKTHLKEESFTNVELFNELAVYFSDNLFNMFKLLDNKWKNSIIKELQDHIGKQSYNAEVTNRNIYEGTEVEFEYIDIENNIKLITGVVEEADYENSIFKINSYENYYDVPIYNITKILKNTKFKYNLNKLNNIDFL